MNDPDIEPKLQGYATEFIRGYSDALEKNYPDATRKIHDMGFGPVFFPLYRRELGKTVALAALFTDYDFYMFFVAAEGTSIKVATRAGDAEGFSREWTFNTPYDKRCERVKDHLRLTDSPTLEVVNAPGTNFISSDAAYMAEQGHGHGNSVGNRAGAKAEQEFPTILESVQRADQQVAFGERYKQFQTSTMSAQARGQEFEKLWREVLDFYGWRPKKIRISGEENDCHLPRLTHSGRGQVVQRTHDGRQDAGVLGKARPTAADDWVIHITLRPRRRRTECRASSSQLQDAGRFREEGNRSRPPRTR
jgi:hypothetical protein